MNVVEFKGGLGNQVTQFAFGMALEKSGRQVMFQNSWYKRNESKDLKHPRPFHLDRFQIPFLHFGPFGESPTIDESKVHFNSQVLQMRNENNFRGYWQYYTYYLEILPFLRQWLQVKTEFYTPSFLKMADRIIDSESVSVHVRRGDYLNIRKAHFGALPARFYFEAIRETTGDLFIFSDDLPWCRQTFKKEYFSRKIYFVNESDYLCFELMKFCKQHIVGNSTFSFWPAFLDDSPDKKVWCPKHYLDDDVDYSEKYRWPKDWIKLEDYL